jgi:hypothetical protein
MALLDGPKVLKPCQQQFLVQASWRLQPLSNSKSQLYKHKWHLTGTMSCQSDLKGEETSFDASTATRLDWTDWHKRRVKTYSAAHPAF